VRHYFFALFNNLFGDSRTCVKGKDGGYHGNDEKYYADDRGFDPKDELFLPDYLLLKT
jgi:hypothetical protein